MSTHDENETHWHEWTTTSRHSTSEGTISYQGCACGAQRILGSATRERDLVAVVGTA